MSKAGHWCCLVAGPSTGWNRTAIGVALYDDQGNLAGARFDSLDRAIERGDLSEWAYDWALEPPENWKAMKKKLESTGNAMSTIRWEGGLGTMVWDQKMVDRLYEEVVEDGYV